MSALLVPRTADMPAWIAAYQAAGFKLIPIPVGRKSPMHKDWQLEENCHVPPDWTASVGLALAYCGLMTLDIDAYEQAYFWCQEHGIDLAGLLNAPDAVQISSGRPGHYKLVYRLPAWSGPVTRKQVNQDGKAVIDFRCATKNGYTVQDVAPPSIHPGTGQPYTWLGDWRNIPEIPADLFNVWLELLEHAPVVRTHAGPVPGTEELKSALFAIDPDLPRDEWIRAGMALHSADPGADWLFDEWSAKGTKYVGDDIASVWDSFDVTEGGITVGTLFHMAKEVGWKAPADIAHETFKASLSAAPSAAMNPLLTDIPEGVFLLPSNPISHGESAWQIFSQIAPTYKMFIHGGVLSEAKKIDGRWSLYIMGVDDLRARLDEFKGKTVMSYISVNDGFALKTARCTKEKASALIKTNAMAEVLPNIRAVVASPVIVERDGVATPLNKGYHPDSGGILVTGGKKVSEVSVEKATVELKSLIRDFRFQSSADLSRALAMLITPALKMGGFFSEPTPIQFIEAEESQSGKGVLQSISSRVYGEAPVILAKRDGGVGSLDESLSSALVEGNPFIPIDNVRGAMKSQFLESAITAPGRIMVRIPNQRSVPIDPRGVTFQLTSNGVNATPDLANRACITRIRKQPPGYSWLAWREGGPLQHVKANQAYYLGCVFSVVTAWVAAGKPAIKGGDHDMHQWAGSLDWIVQNLFGCAPLLAGHRAQQDRVSQPNKTWLRQVCLEVRTAERLEEDLRAHDIRELCEEGDIEWPTKNRPQEDEAAARMIGRIMGKLYRDAKTEAREIGEPDADVRLDVIEVDGYTVTRVSDKVPRNDPSKGFLKTFLYTVRQSEDEEALPVCLR